MSIIFGTLERLESDSLGPAREQEQRELPRPDVEGGKFPVRGLTTSLLFIMAVANLLLWYWSNQVNVPPQSVTTPVASESVAAGETGRRVMPASTTVKSAPSLQLIEPNGRKIVAVKFATVEDITTVSQVVVDKPVTSLVTNSMESSPAAASIKSSSASTQTLQSKPAKTESETARPVETGVKPVFEVAPEIGIEDIIEEARLALSRGRYQQALGLLETLDAVPETRADFWLLKGSAYLAIGQLAMAETALETAQLGAPYNAQIGVQRAILEQEKGDHAEALKVLEPLADRHQNVPEIFLNLGYSQQALGAERAAQRSFRVFLRLTAGRSLYDQQRRAIQEWLKTAPQS